MQAETVEFEDGPYAGWRLRLDHPFFDVPGRRTILMPTVMLQRSCTALAIQPMLPEEGLCAALYHEVAPGFCRFVFCGYAS